MPEANTIVDLLGTGIGNAAAIAAPGREDLTYDGLLSQVDRTREQLASLGIGGAQTVAIVLPNGPEMATAFLSVAAAATTAPLNPGYRRREFSFYLEDLEADLLVVLAGRGDAAREAATGLGIPVAELIPRTDEAAGLFDLDGTVRDKGAHNPPGANDIALVLHTSGTTSRPKIVPLSHTNLCSSACNIRESLRLGPDDGCLNVMPLFHIHGLMAALLGSLAAGGRVFCTTGFDALRFFSWLDESQSTWYTAVPTMHQAIVARARRNAESIARAMLRFVRSSSAALPPQVMAELEETFGVAVIEAYGMTEAAHQMASNPLPPEARKPGTVGIAAGPEIAILDTESRVQGPGQLGEVAIRGDNVTRGYRNNPEANNEAFTHGWFRTGDQGFLDEGGYLHLTGRLKEIINRGGEKISPREVDEVLIDHPSVAQAVTFAVPHQKLGEEVAAALVLKEGSEASETEIRRFVSQRLADFKVPRRVIVVDEIPKGPTGKLQRIGLAQKLGLA